jgi:hypothetical protein
MDRQKALSEALSPKFDKMHSPHQAPGHLALSPGSTCMPSLGNLSRANRLLSLEDYIDGYY